MKKAIVFVILLAMAAALFVPVTASAKKGDLLFKVDWIADKDKFVTVDYWKGKTVKFEEKYDLSNSTSDLLLPVKSTGDKDGQLCYFEETGYKISANTNYTIYFEAASPHHTKYSGIVIMREPGDFDPKTDDDEKGNDSIPVHKRIVMLSGHYSDEGDTKDANGKRWTETFFCYDRNSCDDTLLGTGYSDDHRLTSHPKRIDIALPAGFNDNCSSINNENATETHPGGVFFTAWKVEYKGLDVSAWYLDGQNKWVKADSEGSAVTYTAEDGADIVLGVSCRDGYERHNYCNNLRLVEGVGLSYEEIVNAQPASSGSGTPAPSAPTGDNAVWFAGAAILAMAAAVGTFVVRRRRYE